MAPWTYPVVDVRSGVQIADHVPFKIDSFSDQLGVAVGSMTGSLPVGAGPIDTDEALLLGRRAIVPCKDGHPVAAPYVVTQHGQYGNRSTEVQFTAERCDYLLKRRRVWSTLQFAQQDQLTIVRALLGYAVGLYPLTGVDAIYTALMQQLPTAAQMPWWSFDQGLSGILRDRLDNDSGYQMQQDLQVADLITKLSQLEDGEGGTRAAMGLDGSFDYRLDCSRDSITGAIEVLVRLGYPRLGSADPLPLEYPGNIASWSVGADASDTETMTRVFGAGSGVSRIMGPTATDHTAHDQGWPLLMGSATSTASESGTLAEQARSRLNEFSGPNEGWNVSVGQDLIGSYELGDTAQLRIRNRRWADLRRVDVRITGHKVTPSRQGRAGRVDLMVTPL